MSEDFVLQTARPLIEFQGVYKTYTNGTHAIRDFNLKIHEGEFVSWSALPAREKVPL